jgi:hypothetical protein
MITVQILINGQVVVARSARNVGTAEKKDIYVYHVDDGRTLYHDRTNGAVVLERIK